MCLTQKRASGHETPQKRSAHLSSRLQGCDGIVHVNLQRKHLAASERRAVVARVVQEEVKQPPAARLRQLIEPPARAAKPVGPAPRAALSDASNRLPEVPATSIKI